MVSFSQKRIDEIFSKLRNKHIAVIGDLMIDRYFMGTVARLSPEAPVPVVEVKEESNRLGGAANVANNIASLGGIPLMIGVAGDDQGALLLKKLVGERGFPSTGIVLDPTRPTTIKSRVIAHNQHVVRIDQEDKTEIDRAIQEKIVLFIQQNIGAIDGIILEDYNKGVLTRNLVHEIIDIARKNKKVITVDPKFNNFFDYTDVTVFKPNRKESEEALGRRLKSIEEAETAAREIQQRLHAENVLMTMSELGMLLIEQSGESSRVATTARKVADVSGAGDTVIATLTMALVSGTSVREAAALANLAGGIVCGEVGIVPIDPVLLQTSAWDILNGEQR
jgi:rfaE bifunctional protein kinase chain/domain